MNPTIPYKANDTYKSYREVFYDASLWISDFDFFFQVLDKDSISVMPCYLQSKKALIPINMTEEVYYGGTDTICFYKITVYN